MENEITPYSHWEDEGFVSEMENRYNEYKTGKVKTVTLDEVETKARKVISKL